MHHLLVGKFDGEMPRAIYNHKDLRQLLQTHTYTSERGALESTGCYVLCIPRLPFVLIAASFGIIYHYLCDVAVFNQLSVATFSDYAT